jgi:hypothetical protein
VNQVVIKVSNMKTVIGLLIVISGFLSYIELTIETERYSIEPDLGIVKVPKSLEQGLIKVFDRYTMVEAPNGKPIHIVAQRNVSNEQMLRCRNILEHYLTDFPGSKYGYDKSAVANKMADNQAVLALLNGKDDGNWLRTLKVALSGINGQELFEEEIQVEGHEWYIRQNYQHRDAAYEEILHFVHDYGIGVDGPNTTPGALPQYQKVIRKAQVNGLSTGLWASDERSKDWIKELDEENSLSQEYWAAVVDTYYGLWGAWKGKRGMWGIYAAKVRKELKDKDPVGFEMMNNMFLHPYLTYNARIDEGFEGVFSLRFDAGIPYTYHSRYLKDITLLGANNSGVCVNELDNDITGNEGVNTVIFSGTSKQYKVLKEEEQVIVIDMIQDRDGKNKLRNVENISFSDKTIQL